MNILLLILSLPTENAATRMRAWRALKTSGAAVLRDGVYLMPDRQSCQHTLDTIAADVISSGGSSYVLRATSTGEADFTLLFNRSDDYATLMTEIAQIRTQLSEASLSDVLKQTRRLRKTFAGIVEIDFFPGEAQGQADQALGELELACARVLAPDEPHITQQAIGRLAVVEYQGRTWATRHRPWVDRLACAWFIRRFIDPQATILWLANPADCPIDALGFDFDGATFSHVGTRVSFEVLLASFGFDQPGLQRLGQLVHYLDVGGVQPSEAPGVESILSGLRTVIQDDDQLLQMASSMFDSLLLSFQDKAMQPTSSENPQ
ncbi:chromate resistance protein ChrB domain-containing protein [Undibacterium rugosum]|uniref:Chromate resistance protein n=1 Tax=Undibacterium rugosum TaxID=2762291 RepID=A0A923I5R5_9BURK|nr:chromate resistance protein ChrB domain-containing protein [Undibacterium rugosum]MBC3937047.1 chromate resistance protein [Undibacterium rugosum]MBR7780266.1 chromate resistance protein [Undibacterium rugosum]